MKTVYAAADGEVFEDQRTCVLYEKLSGFSDIKGKAAIPDLTDRLFQGMRDRDHDDYDIVRPNQKLLILNLVRLLPTLIDLHESTAPPAYDPDPLYK